MQLATIYWAVVESIFCVMIVGAIILWPRSVATQFPAVVLKILALWLLLVSNFTSSIVAMTSAALTHSVIGWPLIYICIPVQCVGRLCKWIFQPFSCHFVVPRLDDEFLDDKFIIVIHWPNIWIDDSVEMVSRHIQFE